MMTKTKTKPQPSEIKKPSSSLMQKIEEGITCEEAESIITEFLDLYEEKFKDVISTMESRNPPRSYRKRYEASLRAEKECLQKLWMLRINFTEFKKSLDKADLLANWQ